LERHPYALPLLKSQINSTQAGRTREMNHLRAENPQQPRITEVAFAKNEGRFLLEWIAYHRINGVSDFLIYTNDCEDESPLLLERLQELGIVTHVPNPLRPGEPAQNKALHAAKNHPLVAGADYVLQIDPDEFLCVKTGGGTLQDLIATAPDADCICVQMRFFGDNGLASLGDSLVIEALTGASPESFEENGIVKSLARNSDVYERITVNHMPAFAEGCSPRVFNSGGVEIPTEVYGGQRFRVMPPQFRSMKFAQLNHYAVRTFADYCAKKLRGTAANNDAKLTMAYWRRRNRNEEQDFAIHRHLPAVTRQLAEWLRDPVLAERNRRCFEAYEAILKKSEAIFS
jgi:hypothetical protein